MANDLVNHAYGMTDSITKTANVDVQVSFLAGHYTVYVHTSVCHESDTLTPQRENTGSVTFGTLPNIAIWVSCLDTWAGSDFYPLAIMVSPRRVLS